MMIWVAAISTFSIAAVAAWLVFQGSRHGIKSVRYGFNPNSSSLGADVTGLLLAGGIAMAIAVALSIWIRLSARLGGGTAHGKQEPR